MQRPLATGTLPVVREPRRCKAANGACKLKGFLPAMVQESISANFAHSLRKQVLQKAAHKLGWGEPERTALLAGNGDAVLVVREDPIRTNRHSVTVASQVGKRPQGIVSGALKKNSPPFECCAAQQRMELFNRSFKPSAVFFDQLLYRPEHQPAEDRRQRHAGEKVTAGGIDRLPLALGRESAPTDQQMKMGMKLQLLSPCMQHRNHPQLRAFEASILVRKALQSRADTFEQPSIHLPGTSAEKIPQRIGNREDCVVSGKVRQPNLVAMSPLPRGLALTLRAMTVAAAAGNLRLVTTATRGLNITQFAGATPHNGL